MSTTPNPAPVPEVVTQDERTYATLAHALQVIGGWIAPLVIFLLQSRSKFVRFHALQALFFQLGVLIFWVVFVMLWFTMMFAGIFASIAQQGSHPGSPPVAVFFLFPMIWLLGLGMWVTVLVVAVLYAVRAGRGEWAEYPVIGKWVRHILHI
ncbi:MAG TPA: DUF4870 domain-containing protein [Terriglobales bacterium]|nr:DUF4870 domain-containing protein [Terriglobales bacterium]